MLVKGDGGLLNWCVQLMFDDYSLMKVEFGDGGGLKW